VLSGRYQCGAIAGHDVDLGIYYHPDTSTTWGKMMKASSRRWTTARATSSPYQHKTVRIVEFPRYDSFAQSFPRRFRTRIDRLHREGDHTDEDDIDYPSIVTRTKVAHQWWAHQVVGGNVRRHGDERMRWRSKRR